MRRVNNTLQRPARRRSAAHPCVSANDRFPRQRAGAPPPRLHPPLVAAVLGLTPAESQGARAAAPGRPASAVYGHLRRIDPQHHSAGQGELGGQAGPLKGLVL